MDLMPEPSVLFNPSQLRRDIIGADSEEADARDQDDAEELQDIAEGIDKQLEALDDDDDLDVDEEDEADGADGRDRRHLGGLMAVRHRRNGEDHDDDVDHALLYDVGGSQEASKSDLETLQVLYEARGHEIMRLKQELASLKAHQELETRHLRHELVLCRGDKERLAARAEHLESVADGQVEDNRRLRDRAEALEANLKGSNDIQSELKRELESSHLLAKTLQSQLVDLQKSDTIFKARQHHDETVRALRDRHEAELHRLQQEIEKLRIQGKSKENEADLLHAKVAKIQRDYEILLIEKSETIKGLQDRLEASQNRLAQHISETSTQGYSNVKALHERYKLDQEKYAAELVAFSDEIGALKASVAQKEDEVKAVSNRLRESQEKYLSLKRRARQYQAHCKDKESKLKEQIVSSEDSYRTKLMSLQSRMEAAYLSKEKQVEQELLEMQAQFSEELSKFLRLRSCSESDEGSSASSNGPVPNHQGVLREHHPTSRSTPSSTEELDRLFEDAKKDVRDRLKRPSGFIGK